MIFTALLFATSFILSGIAAYFSVVGLIAIFPGAFWSIAILGGTIEVAKLVTTSLLYRDWKFLSPFIRNTLLVMVFIVMVITSTGIFGFLSKAHIEATMGSNNNTIELKILTTQENIAKEKLNYLLARAKDPSTASNRLDKQIQDTQKELKDISTKRLPLLREETAMSADVGPAKYIAEMIYGETEGGIDKAVRLVIFTIMLVFDPLAILLLIAANMRMARPKDQDPSDPEYTRIFNENIFEIPNTHTEQ